MQIHITDFVEGARQATGLAVIIDVFRAFSVACYVAAGQSERIIPVEDVEQARALQAQYPNSILIGEREGRRIPGFGYGNSPTEIEGVEFSGRTVIHTTTNGTRGLVNATAADEVITGSFVNAQAIVAYIRQRQPHSVSLVAMGTRSNYSAEEDRACATYLRDLLEGHQPDFAAIKAKLRHSQTGQKFFDPAIDWAHEGDFELCLSLNRFDFVLKTEPLTDGLLSLRKLAVEA